MPVLETPRLLLRPPRSSDMDALYAFLGNPVAMRFTHHHGSLRECRRRLAAFEWQRRRTGYAAWAVVTRADQTVVGWGGLYDDPFDTGWGAELGYAFHPAVWGQGYATELAHACLDWADRALTLPGVCAFTHPDNAASARVLHKAGFRPVRLIAGMNRILHRRLQENWPSVQADPPGDC